MKLQNSFATAFDVLKKFPDDSSYKLLDEKTFGYKIIKEEKNVQITEKSIRIRREKFSSVIPKSYICQGCT